MYVILSFGIQGLVNDPLGHMDTARLWGLQICVYLDCCDLDQLYVRTLMLGKISTSSSFHFLGC